MPISTSTGRSVKEIIDDPDFQKVSGAKTRFCQITDKLLSGYAQKTISYLSSGKWADAYDSFTDLRRLIEIKNEACK